MISLLSLILVAAVCAGPTLWHDEVYTHHEAEEILKKHHISVFYGAGHCAQADNPLCTSLAGIKRNCLHAVTDFHRRSGCNVTITGGTERGHDNIEDIYTHSSGRRVEIEKNDCIDNFITSTYERVGETAYKHSRNWWYDHTTHWDLECHLHT